MGIFDFLRKKSSPPNPQGDKRIQSLGRMAADKRAQNYDRIEAIQELATLATPEAAEALLKRFSFSIDPSITDQEEKDIAFRGVAAGGVTVVPAIRAFCLRAEALTWPLKLLRELLDDEAYRDELVSLLEVMDTEYVRNVEPKIHIIQALETVIDERVRIAVEPFLDDVNETVRFHAVEAVFLQGSAASVEPLVKLLINEESVRVKNKVAEGLAARAWTVPADLREAAGRSLHDTDDYAIGPTGDVRRLSSALA